MRSVVVVQARLDSSRLPKKIIAKLGNSTVVEQIVRRCRAAHNVDEVVVACPTKDVEEIFNTTGIASIGGPEVDVLSRMLVAAIQTKATRIVRTTCDNPLVCPRLIEVMLGIHTKCKVPVLVNTVGNTFPDGLDLEVYDVEWLKTLGTKINPDDREYFAQYVRETYGEKVVERLVHPENLGLKYRFTVDYPEDLEFVSHIYGAMGKEIWDSRQIIGYLSEHPHLLKINAKRIDGNFGKRVK